MKHDLTMFADDWFLGLWWAEFGPGEASIMPDGGQWMLLARITTARDGVVQQAATWIREEAVRRAGESEWRRSITWNAGSAIDQLVFAEGQQAWISEHVHARTGKLHIGGGADVMASLLARNSGIPPWLSVLVAVERSSTDFAGPETSPSGPAVHEQRHEN